MSRFASSGANSVTVRLLRRPCNDKQRSNSVPSNRITRRESCRGSRGWEAHVFHVSLMKLIARVQLGSKYFDNGLDDYIYERVVVYGCYIE